MTILQLEYFIALSETLHYTKTAELLHISQPSLSYEIRELEKELGAPLFLVEKKKVSLSDCGQTFLPYAKKALDTLERGKKAAEDRHESSRYQVRLGYFHSIGATFIPSVVNAFRLSHPESRVNFLFSELPAREIPGKVLRGEIDLGFALEPGGVANPVQITRQPLYLYVQSDHPLVKKGYAEIPDLEDEKMIMLERGSNLRSLIERHFSDEGIVPVTVFEVPECNTAIQYVALGYGISILPPMLNTDAGRVVMLPIREYEKELSREICLLSGKAGGTAPDPVAEVRDFIVAQYTR